MVIALVLGIAGLVVSLAEIAPRLLPRQFTTLQQRRITDWEAGARWRELPAGTIFPATVRYPPPAALNDAAGLTLTATRIGIARQASCRGAIGPAAAAAVLARHEACLAMPIRVAVNVSPASSSAAGGE